MATRNFSDYDRTKVPNAENMCFGIVVSDSNPDVTAALLDGAVRTFELIYGARQMTLNDGYDAVIALGAVIRGETPSFDCTCHGLSAGFAQLNATSSVPVIFGVLTTNTLQQAIDRAGGKLGNKGEECAVNAIKMAKF